MKKAFVHGIVTTAAIAGAFLAAPHTQAQEIAVNSGSLGLAGNGTHLGGLEALANGNNPLAAAGGKAGGFIREEATQSIVPYLPALNPAANQPFTIELWVYPTASSDDSSPLFNRESDNPRSGWIFFQRPESPTAGWNFRMYNGNGSDVGWNLTGGSSELNTWHHLVAVWDGSIATLYYNGANTNATNGGVGGYRPNAGPDQVLSVGRYDTGATAFTGGIDEIAFYNVALTPTQIATHFSKASSLVAGEYSSQVIADGALEYLQFTELIPEPGSAAMLVLAGGFLATRRRRV